MNQLTRRGMFTAVAGATAGVALIVPAAARASTQEPRPVSTNAHEAIIARARAAARSTTPLPRPDAVTTHARVALCRAWDHQVYLIVDDEVHGFATVDPRTFAIAVAAQLVKQPVAVQYWGHRPGTDGTGSFEGVLVAADERDLPHRDLVG